MRLERLDTKCDVRIGSHRLGHGRSFGVAQEFEVFGVLARVCHPTSALLDPVFAWLRLGRCEANVIELEHGSFLPLRFSAQSKRGGAQAPPVATIRAPPESP